MMKILFLSPVKSSFIKSDWETLKEKYDVRWFIFNKKRVIDGVRSLLCVFAADLLFLWFTAPQFFLHVLIAKYLGKKVIGIVGGYEVVGEKSSKYGVRLSPLKTFLERVILENCDVVVVVSKFIRKKVLEIASPKKVVLLYNGVDLKKFSYSRKKENVVLMVASNINARKKLKGLSYFLNLAKTVDARFVLIGGKIKDVESYSYVSHDEIVNWYKKAKVYVQLSAVESFGLSVVEAMACGCWPIVFNVGAFSEYLPEECLVPYGDLKILNDKVNHALNEWNPKKGRFFRKIAGKFDFKKRKKKLLKVISDLYEGRIG